MIGNNSVQYPYLNEALNMYAREYTNKYFEWSSITVNDTFAASCHRDVHNCALSYFVALGPYTGGDLYAWDYDNRRKPLKALKADDARAISGHDGGYFDGTLAHQTGKFEGKRVSIIWYLHSGVVTADEESLAELQLGHCRLPKKYRRPQYVAKTKSRTTLVQDVVMELHEDVNNEVTIDVADKMGNKGKKNKKKRKRSYRRPSVSL